MMGMGRGGRGNGAGQLPTSADRADGLAFLKLHAPEQYRIIEAMPDDSDQRQVLETFVARAYANYQRIKADDPDLYGVIVTRVEAEDGIVKLSADLRQASDADRPAAKQRLREQVAKWFELNLQERKLRLDKLKRTVRAAEDKLNADRAGRDQIINERVGRILKSGNAAGGGESWIPTGGGGDH